MAAKPQKEKQMEHKEVSKYIETADLMELLSLLPEIKSRLLTVLAETDNSWTQAFAACYVSSLFNSAGEHPYEKN